MNHLLEAWITWIKYKPYFTARTNSKLNALTVWSRGAKKGETKKDLWGGTLCQSEGGGVVKTLTSGIHICERLREEPELEIRREMDSNEKGKKRERDGGSKDNDSYMSGVMCLISLRNWEEWESEGCSRWSLTLDTTVFEKQERWCA